MNRRAILSVAALAAIGLVAGAVGFSRQSSARTKVEVFKDANCGCCNLWIEHMKAAGFDIVADDTSNLERVKSELRVPTILQSCHTATVGGYVIEGHIPAEDVKRLLEQRPKAVGIAVPGMPIGSPGMEQGARRDPYQVIQFDSEGTQSVFSEH